MRPGISIEEMEIWPDAVWRMAALLRAGSPPQTVFERLARERAEIPVPTDALEKWITAPQRSHLAAAQTDYTLLVETCARAARYGQPVSSALEGLLASGVLARNHSRQRVAELAACWSISERTGAGLSCVLERLARFYENEIDVRQARDSAMSGPTSTGHILSWLPLLGLGLGIVMGTDPLGVLFGSVAGGFAAVVGLGLALAGRRWTARLVAAAEKGEL